MKTSTLTLISAAALAALLASACTDRKGWSVDGTITGAAEGSAIAVEANNAGHWYVLDSVKVDKNGRFAYSSPTAADRAEIMRLTIPGKGSVYFPVDSVDAVSVEAEASSFGHGHRLSGTDMARTIARVDSIAAAGDDMTSIARQLTNIITADTTGAVAYYTVGKSIDGKLIFDPNDSFGNRVYGAAAQVFINYHPLDSRGAALRQAFFAGRQALGRTPRPEERIIEVEQTGLFDIVRYDNKGVKHSLAESASKGHPVILSFTRYDMDNSPTYNSILYKLYEQYGSKGLAIYQIAFDADEVSWKEAAVNLPWTTVWNSPSDGMDVLYQYNVGAFPMTYLINRNGDLGKRVINPADLPQEVAKLF